MHKNEKNQEIGSENELYVVIGISFDIRPTETSAKNMLFFKRKQGISRKKHTETS